MQRLSLKHLIYVLFGVIVLVLGVMMAASFTAQVAVGRAVAVVGQQLLPIRNMSTELSRAYVDQETELRRFLRTADPAALEAYDLAAATEERVVPMLRQEISRARDASELQALLEDELAAAAAWKNQAAEPQMAARLAGAISPDQIDQILVDEKRLFDDVRQRFRALNGRIDDLMLDRLRHIDSVQRTANTVQLVAGMGTALAMLGAMFAVRQMLTRPVVQLVRDVRAVADGDYSQPICTAGPREIGEVSLAVKDMRDKLEVLARFDAVTGLANRAETIARLSAALESGRVPDAGVGVLFCDIDHFKDVNDSWGHAFGDAVLSTIAVRIRECVRLDDTVGRIGGDEMLVLLPSIRNLDEVAERVRCRVAEPIVQFGRTVNITLSIGATLSLPGEAAAVTMARADAAMYRAKQAGRNRVVRIDQ